MLSFQETPGEQILPCKKKTKKKKKKKQMHVNYKLDNSIQYKTTIN